MCRVCNWASSSSRARSTQAWAFVGHVPKGRYFLKSVPHTSRHAVAGVRYGPGLRALRSGQRRDRTSLVVVVAYLRRHFALLAFVTDQSYVGASISVHGTFSVQLQPGRHLAEMASMPLANPLHWFVWRGGRVVRLLQVQRGDVRAVVTAACSSMRSPCSCAALFAGAVRPPDAPPRALDRLAAIS